MKKLIYIIFLIIPISSMAQYSGGSYDGYEARFKGVKTSADSNQLNRIWKGGSFDGYSKGIFGKNTIPDSIQLNRIWKGGSLDGYSTSMFGKYVTPDSNQLNRIWKGGSLDGYAYICLGFFNTTYLVKEDWEFHKSSKFSFINIPKSIVAKVASRDIFYGDAIGLFYKRNNLDYCAGYGIWMGDSISFKVYGDDTTTIEKDGFSDNETYIVKFWDGQKGLEYSTIPKFRNQNTDKYITSSISYIDTLIIDVLKELKIPLKVGWNLISSNISISSNDSVSQVLKNISSKLLIMKNHKGLAYIPQYNINNIGKWDLTQGYLVYMNASDTLKILGSEINTINSPINVSAGWNTISYFGKVANNIANCLSSITDDGNLLIAKTLDGSAYIPSYGINNIGNMIPGVGYKIYVNKNDIIYYP